MRCLIVEDEPFEREGMQFFLEEYAEIDLAEDGQQGVECFARALQEGKPYQLICLDILMPTMDGQEALKRMRQLECDAEISDQKKAVIIMTTAMNSREDIEEAIWLGDCTDYLVKPIIRADLIAMLRRYGLISEQP
jgi:two-component system, chemotaxis family, chemotaxis protein CheY